MTRRPAQLVPATPGCVVERLLGMQSARVGTSVLVLLFLVGCQAVQGTLELEKPGQAAAFGNEIKRNQTVAHTGDLQPPQVVQSPPVPDATIVDDSTALAPSNGDLISIQDHSSEAAVETTGNCLACPIVPIGLPPSAFVGMGTPADAALLALGEYVCNGGDRETAVVVHPDWRVFGLHQGDTVVHYDTIDGKTHVQPSNEVCLYTPRFAAVRKVYGLVISEQHDRAAGVELPIRIVQSDEVNEATTVVQPLQPGRKHSIRMAQQFREHQPGEAVENEQRPATAQDRFLPFENLTIIRRGFYDNSEKARLAERLEAAVFWTHDQAPQILIDNKAAIELVGNVGLQSTYTYELPPGKSRVRVVKIASKQNALPGETVDFTIRFDNVGERVIGNVTLLDRLHERLEFVPNSQSCTLKANFSTEDEDGSPRVLRWEIAEPLPVGQGGIVRFQCRVR